MVRLASGAAATYLTLGRGHLSGSADERSLDRVGAGGVRPPAATAIESRVGSTCPGRRGRATRDAGGPLRRSRGGAAGLRAGLGGGACRGSRWQAPAAEVVPGAPSILPSRAQPATATARGRRRGSCAHPLVLAIAPTEPAVTMAAKPAQISPAAGRDRLRRVPSLVNWVSERYLGAPAPQEPVAGTPTWRLRAEITRFGCRCSAQSVAPSTSRTRSGRQASTARRAGPLELVGGCRSRGRCDRSPGRTRSLAGRDGRSLRIGVAGACSPAPVRPGRLFGPDAARGVRGRRRPLGDRPGRERGGRRAPGPPSGSRRARGRR